MVVIEVVLAEGRGEGLVSCEREEGGGGGQRSVDRVPVVLEGVEQTLGVGVRPRSGSGNKREGKVWGKLLAESK